MNERYFDFGSDEMLNSIQLNLTFIRKVFLFLFFNNIRM